MEKIDLRHQSQLLNLYIVSVKNRKYTSNHLIS